MFDPLRAPYAFELQALHHQEALLREAAHVRLLRALDHARRGGHAERSEASGRPPAGRGRTGGSLAPLGMTGGAGRTLRPGWGSWLVRLVGTQLVRWGHRLLPLSPPPGAAAAGPAAGALGRAIPPPSPRERPGRRSCRRPPARLPRGLSLAGE
jgi:hypothetical protein